MGKRMNPKETALILKLLDKHIKSLKWQVRLYPATALITHKIKWTQNN